MDFAALQIEADSLQTKRERLLDNLFVLAAGRTGVPVSFRKAASLAGILSEHMHVEWQQLSQAGFVENPMIGDEAKLTVKGAEVARIYRAERKRRQMEENIDKRFALLNAMFEESGGDPMRKIALHNIASDLGFEGDDLKKAYLYLSKEGLIQGALNGMASARITHEGIKEVEQKRAAPALPTPHFSINVDSLNGNLSNVIGNSNTVTQTANIQIGEALKELEEDLRKLDGGNLSPQSKQLIDSISANDPVATMSAADAVAKAGEGRLEKMKEFVSKAASSATGGAAVLALKALLAAHGIHL